MKLFTNRNLEVRNLLLNSSHLVDLLLGVVKGIITIFFYYEMFYLICFLLIFGLFLRVWEQTVSMEMGGLGMTGGVKLQGVI